MDSKSQRGQALSEFVILLTIIMGLCAGMIYVSRLLTLQYWTRQEARMTAFRYTWPARLGGVSPFMDMNSTRFGKPKVVRTSWYSRSVKRDYDLRFDMARNDQRQTMPTADPGIMLASNDSFVSKIKNVLTSPISMVDQAWALSQRFSAAESWENEERKVSRLEKSLHEILAETEFGKRFCAAMVRTLSKHGINGEDTFFSQAECHKDYEQAFALQLTKETRWRKMFADYGRLLERNWTEKEALIKVAEREAKTQFNTLFDAKVKGQLMRTLPYGGSRARHYTRHRNPAEAAETLQDSELVNSQVVDAMVTPMLLEARYRGGLEALNTVMQYTDMISSGSANVNATQEYLREMQRDGVLHEDLDDLSGGNDFRIRLEYAPIPASFTKAYTKLTDGVMYNVLAKDNNLQLEYIEQDNILAHTTYPVYRSFFSYLEGRMATREAARLEASFMLVDHPWHIPRQYGTYTNVHVGWGLFGGHRFRQQRIKFRELGGEYDDMEAVTEEGILRRRTYGLWLVPSKPSKLAAGLASITGSEAISTAIDGLALADNFTTFGKDALAAVMGNPELGVFKDINSAINDLPQLVPFNFTPPVLPAVRPQVYPWSTELSNDRLMGGNRGLSDYENEQRAHLNNNP